MDVKYLVDELIKEMPEPKRHDLLVLIEKIKTIVLEAPEELRIPALQVASLTLLDAADPDAITAVEPAVTKEEEP